MSYARITGTGSYVPPKVLTNYDLEKMMDTSHAWIVERTGIEQRHIADENDNVVSMAEKASREALMRSGVAADQIDLIIVATCTPEKIFPSTACFLQQRLGAVKAGAFDVSAACSGFVYALATADKFIRTGAARHVLVVGSEVMSRVMDWKDRSTCVLFGDGAGAVLVSASKTPGVLATKLYSDGGQADVLYLPSGIEGAMEAEAAVVNMKGREVFRLAVERLAQAVRDVTTYAGVAISDIDWMVPHQANLRIITMLGSKLGISLDHVIITVKQHANTSSASIPLALHHGIIDGRIQPGQLLLFEAFGGGLTWGSILLRF